jgi:hypothetical protein
MGKENQQSVDEDAAQADIFPEIPLAPELASLAPTLETETWQEWSSAADLSPDISFDGTTE